MPAVCLRIFFSMPYSAPMNATDWTIIIVYLCTLIALSAWWGRKFTDADDYYLGNRNFAWWSAGISVLATQSSAISFVSIPAFVAIAEGGGLVFLQYEIAVPIAMLLISWLLIPQLRARRYVSIYEYLEHRYDPSIRRLVSGVFLMSRGLAAGVAIYATSVVLSVVLNWPAAWTILLIGVATLIYDTLGGMRAVVYSDVIQMIVLVVGLVFCIVFAVNAAGGVEAALTAFPAERQATLSWTSSIGDNEPMPFWAFLIGGCFLYMAYYGTDQSQAQRLLATRSEDDSRRALLLNGYLRPPLIGLYVLF